MNLTGTQLLAIGLSVVILGSVLGWWSFGMPGITPPTTPTTPTTPTGHDSGAIQLEVIDYILTTGVTTSTTTADVCLANGGTFDFLKAADTLTVAANPDEMGTMFAEGSEIIIRVGCTGNPSNGLDYYDGWYYCRLYEGEPIYYLNADMLSVVSSTPTYTYKVSTAGAITTGHIVTWTSGTTNYWNIGKLAIYPRTSATDFETYLIYQGADLASVTDGATWVDTAAEITANATLVSDDETLTFKTYIANASLGWGWPLYVISQSGEFKEYHSFLILTTQMTAIGSSKLLSGGWVPINDGTLYAEKGFYYDVTKNMGPQYTSKGSKHDFSVDIGIDATAAAASTAFLFRLWALDVQLESDVSVGSTSTSLPTAYGFVTAYGPGALIQAKAYTTSSGAGTGFIMYVYITTAA